MPHPPGDLAHDPSYPGEALPQVSVEFRSAARVAGTTLDRVIPDTGADATVLPLLRGLMAYAFQGKGAKEHHLADVERVLVQRNVSRVREGSGAERFLLHERPGGCFEDKFPVPGFLTFIIIIREFETGRDGQRDLAIALRLFLEEDPVGLVNDLSVTSAFAGLPSISRVVTRQMAGTAG